jgi:hypothetical protein
LERTLLGQHVGELSYMSYFWAGGQIGSYPFVGEKVKRKFTDIDETPLSDASGDYSAANISSN